MVLIHSFPHSPLHLMTTQKGYSVCKMVERVLSTAPHISVLFMEENSTSVPTVHNSLSLSGTAMPDLTGKSLTFTGPPPVGGVIMLSIATCPSYPWW